MLSPHRIARTVAAAAVLAAGSIATWAQPAPAGAGQRWTAIRAGRLFDGKSTTLATNQAGRHAGQQPFAHARGGPGGRHIKKWTVGSPIQAPLDAIEILHKRRPFNPDDVRSVDVRVATSEAKIVNDREMRSIFAPAHGGGDADRSHDLVRGRTRHPALAGSRRAAATRQGAARS